MSRDTTGHDGACAQARVPRPEHRHLRAEPAVRGAARAALAPIRSIHSATNHKRKRATADEQLVWIYLPGLSVTGGQTFLASGHPGRIYNRLRNGREVLCGPGREKRVLRVSPGTPFVLSYDETIGAEGVSE
jgi:hypothetical protein